MTRRLSVRQRFILTALACLLPLLGLVAWVLDASLHNSRSQIYDTQATVSEIVASGVSETLTEYETVLDGAAKTEPISTMDPAGSQELLAQLNAYRPSLIGVFLLDPGGKVISAAGGVDPVQLMPLVEPAAGVALTSGETAVTGKILIPDGDVSVVAMVVPVVPVVTDNEEQGTPVGALGAFISVDRLQRLFLPIGGESSRQTSVMIVSDGQIIASQETDSEAGNQAVTALSDPIGEAVAGKTVRTEYEDGDGSLRLAVLQPVAFPGAAWAVVTSSASPRAYQPNRQLLRNGLIGLGLATALAILLAVLAGEFSVRPLRRLTGQASAIAAGDPTAEVERAGGGEVGDLSEAIAAMADRLRTEARDSAEVRERVEEQATQLREVLRRTVRLQEDERRRIASEIHDAVSPLITGALYQVRALGMGAGAPAAGEDGGNAEDIQVVTDLLERSMDELHDVIFDLRPPDLDDVGVVAAIERYVSQINRSGLPTQLEVIGEARRLSPDARLGVYRIIQEALHNSLRHAHADEALVRIEWLEDRLRVTIIDNGSGFDPERANRAASLGLLSMQERAAAIGATFEIVSRPGAGTAIVLERPWETHLVAETDEAGDGSSDADALLPTFEVMSK